MQNLTKASFLALMIAATPLWAQDTATEEAPAEEATTEAPADTAAEAAGEEGTAQTPAPGSDLNMGTPVGEETSGNAPGSENVREVHGDWQLRCAKLSEDQPEQCQLYQLLGDGNGNSVAEITVIPLPSGGQAAAGVSVVTPLETLLTEQVVLAVDGSQGRRYPYTFCAAIGCVARFGMSQADVNAFKAGNAATLTVVPARAPDQKVQVKVSLNGFTAGFNALAAMNN